MKHLIKQITSPRWLEEGVKSDGKGRAGLLPKAFYKEYKRVYKANAGELLRLIRNESKVYAGQAGEGSQLVWRCRRVSANQYSVLYAVIDSRIATYFAKGWQFVIPETWLLYTVLQPEKLYQIQSGDSYWAWLSADQQLHITPIQGLMGKSQYFLDAIGVSASSHQATYLDLRVLENIDNFKLNALDYLSFSIWHQAKKYRREMPWRQLALATTLLIMTYMGILSLGLTHYEQTLSEEVAVLQNDANDVFVRQRALSEQMETLENYQAFFKRFPATHSLLSLLAQDVKQVAELRSVQLSASLLKVTGSAESATEVLSILSLRDHWSEVSFDRNVQRVKNQENFTISMVYKGLAEKVVKGQELRDGNVEGGQGSKDNIVRSSVKTEVLANDY